MQLGQNQYPYLAMTTEINDIEKLLTRPSGYPKWTIVLSLGWTFLMLSIAFLKQIWCLDANEIGDFLAGAFAPLAFAWLILGYHRQGNELRIQAAELALTRAEFASQTNVLRQTMEQDKIALNVSLLERIIDTIPDRIVDVLDTLKYFRNIRRPDGIAIQNSSWGHDNSSLNMNEMRTKCENFEKEISKFHKQHGSSLLSAMEVTNSSSTRKLRQQAKSLIDWDNLFHKSNEPMERAMWENARKRTGLDHLIQALSHVLADESSDGPPE